MLLVVCCFWGSLSVVVCYLLFVFSLCLLYFVRWLVCVVCCFLFGGCFDVWCLVICVCRLVFVFVVRCYIRV